MKNRIASFTIFLIIFSCLLAWAESGDNDLKPVGPKNPEKSSGLMIPEVLTQRSAVVSNVIDIKNSLVNSTWNIKSTLCNDDGTIKSVQYADRIVDYSYEYGPSGEMTACTMTSGDVSVRMQIVKQGVPTTDGTQTNDQLICTVFNKNDRNTMNGDGKEEPVIIIRTQASSGGLNTFAHKTIDFPFGDIKKALLDVSKMKEGALMRYNSKLKEHYSSIANDRDLAAADPKAYKAISAAGITEDEKRAILDRAVVDIRTAAKEGHVDQASVEFLKRQESRERLVNAETELCEDKIKDAVSYMKEAAKKLLSSKIAVYLDAKEEKIEAIVNLPKFPRNK